MAQWYVKELSKLTSVSVRTLHHYDRIDLLKPSVRLSNGYRVYSEADLLTLQRIIALKFFGFNLMQIKSMLQHDLDVITHFQAQADCLQEQAQRLINAKKTLDTMIAEYKDNKSIAWEKIIHLIEVYHMTEQLEKSWAGKIFNSEELNEYAKFEAQLKNRFSESEFQEFGQRWWSLIEEIGKNLDKDPSSDYGFEMGKRAMNWVHQMYGNENMPLANAVWEKGFKSGAKVEGHDIAPEIITWLDRAMDTFYRRRIYELLNRSQKPAQQKLNDWKQLLTEMFGQAENLKQDLVQMAQTDEKVSPAAKVWLKEVGTGSN